MGTCCSGKKDNRKQRGLCLRGGKRDGDEDESDKKRRKEQEEETDRIRKSEETERKRRRDEEDDKKRKESEEEAKKRRERDEALGGQVVLEITVLINLQNTFLDLPKMINLRILVIQHCQIDDDLAVLLADSLKNCRHLTHVDLQYNRIRERGFAALIIVLKLCIIVLIYGQGIEKKLSLSNRMSVVNVIALLSLPEPVHPSSSEMNPDIYVTIGIQIYPKIGVLSLQEMCLSEMNLGDEGATVVANSFSIMVCMIRLFFYHNAVGEEGATAMARNLPKARALRFLKLSDNHIPRDYEQKFEIMNKLREAVGLPRVLIDLDTIRKPNNDDEADEIAKNIPSMADGKELDFYEEGKKFTAYGKGLIEAANEARKFNGNKPLKISF